MDVAALEPRGDLIRVGVALVRPPPDSVIPVVGVVLGDCRLFGRLLVRGVLEGVSGSFLFGVNLTGVLRFSGVADFGGERGV